MATLLPPLGLPAGLMPTLDSTGNQEMPQWAPRVHGSYFHSDQAPASTQGSPPADSCCPQTLKAGIPLSEVRISEDSAGHRSPEYWLK